jgi:ATPase subunit of ABC transporter with duplicated ATPase domains
LEQKQARLAQEDREDSKRQKVLQRELEWVRAGAKGRQSKGKARLANYEKMLGDDEKQKDEKLEMYIPAGPRLGNKVIEAHDISKGFGDKLLYEHLNFKLPQGGIVGIIGPNGAGKTTLFRMIMGEEKPDSGTFEVGETVKISYVDQAHSDIDPEKTVFETITNGDEWIETGKIKMNSRGYVSRFNFAGGDQQKKVKMLSGGERNRLHLALTLRKEANVLLLDEPTNDLDINTIRALEEALDNFAGCAVIISHDRWFLDRVCTHILAFEGDATAYYFEGGFSEYEENRKQRQGEQIKKFKYKKLVG